MSRLTEAVCFPPVVYVPCSPVGRDDDILSVDLRPTRDGRLALLVYSALDRLVNCCGDKQSWVVMPTADLEKVRVETNFELVLLDIEIPDDFRRHGEEREHEVSPDIGYLTEHRPTLDDQVRPS
jgi:hypothetical protein